MIENNDLDDMGYNANFPDIVFGSVARTSPIKRSLKELFLLSEKKYSD